MINTLKHNISISKSPFKPKGLKILVQFKDGSQHSIIIVPLFKWRSGKFQYRGLVTPLISDKQRNQSTKDDTMIYTMLNFCYCQVVDNHNKGRNTPIKRQDRWHTSMDDSGKNPYDSKHNFWVGHMNIYHTLQMLKWK